MTDNDRSDRERDYAEAVGLANNTETRTAAARAVMAVADRELAALRAELVREENEHADTREAWAKEERELRATIARVEALADEDTHHLRSGVVGMVRLSDLDAALHGPAPAEEPS